VTAPSVGFEALADLGSPDAAGDGRAEPQEAVTYLGALVTYGALDR
jgi:hypothetical protein